jgi:hypothetical protein
MNFKEYQKLAKRTCANLGQPGNDFHMVLGIQTELGELFDQLKKHLAYNKSIDWINVEEETSDILWYIANYCEFNNINADFPIWFCNKKEIPYMSKWESDVLELNYLLGDLSNVIKNEHYDPGYKEILLSPKEIINIMLDVLASLSINLNKIAVLSGANIDIERGMKNNIAKLQVRYPEKFTEENAINRDLEAERRELEK